MNDQLRGSADRNTKLPAVDTGRRALIIAQSPEDAAPLARDFTDAWIVTPGDLPTALPATAAQVDMVVISGVPRHTGQLAAVVTKLVGVLPAGTLLAVTLDDAAGQSLLLDAEPLRGLQLRSTTVLTGIPCVVLSLADKPDDIPELVGLQITAGESEQHLGPAHMRALRELEASRADLQSVRTELARTQERLTRSREKLVRQRRQRALADRELSALRNSLLGALASRLLQLRSAIRRRAVGAARRKKLLLLAPLPLVGLVIISAGAIGLAFATRTGARGGLVSGFGLLTFVLLLVVLRRAHHVQRALATLVTESQGSLGDLQKEAHQQRTALARLTQRALSGDAELQRKLAMVVASGLDTANAVAGLRHDLDRLSTRLPGTTDSVFASVLRLLTSAPSDATESKFNALLEFRTRGISIEPTPHMDGWALAPDLLAVLLGEVMRLQPHTVVECGSGVSTLWLALLVQEMRLDTRIVALEHEPAFAGKTRQWLEQFGVAEHAEVRDAPLKDPGLPGHGTPWYDMTALDGLDDIGVLLVDGPPAATGEAVRYPAVPLLRDRLAAESVILLDDAMRVDEQHVAAAWLELLPDFEVARLPLRKGAVTFHRGYTAKPAPRR